MAFADFQDPSPGLQMLRRNLERGRLGHAYLFCGGTAGGLETMARTLAKTLNCQKPPAGGATGLALDCCDACSSCRSIQADNHPDVRWVRPESKSRVIIIEQIRELLQAVHLKPTVAAYKVGVIVAADRLNNQAANAFLKTLEEPPDRSLLLLLSVEPDQILETIRSRCLRLNFSTGAERGIDAPAVGWLQDFSDRAAAGQGGVWWRYQLLGTLQAKLVEVKEQIQAALLASSPLARYEEPDPSLREKWEEELDAAVEAEYRRQRTDLLAGLHAWLRDVWLASLGLEAEFSALPNLFGPAQALGRRLTPDAALENLRTWERTQRLLGSNVQEGLTLEVGLLQLRL
ncbi:MAG: DNA polymerase III subunit [Verrucomicrobia bacterium]|nr:DNA polymerase III subunit [Verrucomicrobiota bacterium]